MSKQRGKHMHGISRRTFLGALGAGAAAPAMFGMSTPVRAAQAARHPLNELLRGRHVIRSDRFGRMFPNLPPFAVLSPGLDAALRDLGKKGGLMDAKDPLEVGPVLLITDPNNSVNNRDNPTHTAGMTFLGQFLDHDFTFDLTSRLGVPTAPEDSPNSRTPALDLDSVYGGGLRLSPELYQSGKGRAAAKLKLETGGMYEDLPRMADGVAIIGDPRNDENMMLNGIHAAIIMFHNKVVDLCAARDRRADADELYRTARQMVTWHYQWIVVHQFLPLIIGQDKVDSLLAKGPQIFRPSFAFMPVEFQGAAYRMGHSMVRPSYRANFNGIRNPDPTQAGSPFFGMIFDPAGEGQADPEDLRGGARAERRFIGWQTFFRFDDTSFRTTKRLDTTISTALFTLPTGTIAGPETGITALPQRNLLRQVTWGIPSGQAIAAEMGVAPLAPGDLADVKQYGLDLSTPLWFYILREADRQHDGLQLGDVGGTIVGEVFFQMLLLDRTSYLSAKPHWRPTLPDLHGNVTGLFQMQDLLAYAGAVDRGLGSPPTTV